MFAYDPRRQRCLLFGGRGADDVLGDTWEWDGTAWRQIHTSGPSPRMVGAAATDLTNDRIILFSGWTADQTLLDDTWAWDGEKWELISRAGPPPRISGQLAFDGTGVVLFGGRTRTADGFRDLNDTWRLQGTSWVRTQVPAGADSSGDGGPATGAVLIAPEGVALDAKRVFMPALRPADANRPPSRPSAPARQPAWPTPACSPGPTVNRPLAVRLPCEWWIDRAMRGQPSKGA
jgi:hypothetical protein